MLGKGFLGTYDATVDDKGRVRLPAKFRALLGEDFYIAQGTDAYLCVYPEETWQALTADIKKFGNLDSDVTDFRRIFFANAVDGNFDAAGRVLLPVRQRKYANLTKDVTVVGNFDYFEIWDTELWNQKDFFSAQARKELQAKITSKED